MSSSFDVARRRLTSGEVSFGAAAVAFHTFLALLPLSLAMLGAGALLGGDQLAVERIGRALDPVAPDAVNRFLTDLITDAARRLSGEWWVITGATIAALFLGSRAVVALQRALAFGPSVGSLRPVRSRRPVAIGLTVAGGVSLMVTGTLLVAGRSFFVFLSHWSGHSILLDLWLWLRFPLTASGLFGFILLCYRYGPPHPLPRAVPAAALASGGVLVGSVAFGLYLSLAPRLGAAFGTVGAVTALLGWLYVAAWSILGAAALLAADEGA